MANASVVMGVINLDKPEGMTSHNVVSRLRKLLDMRRIGHGGTLDPAATGVLLVLVGQATRLASYLGGGTKVYRTTMRFGEATDSDDADGAVVATGPVPELGIDELRSSAEQLTGEVSQVPPSISAVHHEGERAWQVARRGDKVTLEPRVVRIDAVDVLSWTPPDADVRITCGSGTYIRSIARDWGHALGTCAHVRELRREQSGVFTLDTARTLEDIEQAVASLGAEAAVESPGPALVEVLGRRVALEPDEIARFMQGGWVDDIAGEPGTVPVFGPDDRLLGIAEVAETGSTLRLSPSVVFNS